MLAGLVFGMVVVTLAVQVWHERWTRARQLKTRSDFDTMLLAGLLAAALVVIVYLVVFMLSMRPSCTAAAPL